MGFFFGWLGEKETTVWESDYYGRKTNIPFALVARRLRVRGDTIGVDLGIANDVPVCQCVHKCIAVHLLSKKGPRFVWGNVDAALFLKTRTSLV